MVTKGEEDIESRACGYGTGCKTFSSGKRLWGISKMTFKVQGRCKKGKGEIQCHCGGADLHFPYRNK